MGYKEISGVEFDCDHCGATLLTSGDADVDGKVMIPKGWFGGLAYESSGERGSTVAANWIACKASCVGQAVRKMIDAAKPTLSKDPDD